MDRTRNGKGLRAGRAAACLAALFLMALLAGCEGGTDAVAPSGTPSDLMDPTPAFRDRAARFLAHCDANSGPPSGNIYGQVCPAYTGSGTYDQQELLDRIEGIRVRHGSCDFHMNAILRVLIFDRRRPTLPDDLRQTLIDGVLGFKYWLDEPGDDDLQWWSENHQILYHTAELLAGQLFPEETFTNSGMTGADHVRHALPLLRRWLDRRGRFGLSEWNSNVYFNEDMPALVNLVDFAEDEEIALEAAMLLDTIAFDFAMNYYKGRFATTHGRTYPDRLIEGLVDSTTEAAYILLGLAEPASIEDLSPGNFTGAFLATSDRYAPPAIREAIALDARASVEHRQRDSIRLEEAEAYGIGYETYEDVMFWWGLTGYVAPEVIDGTFRLIEDHGMWDGNTWRDIAFLRPLMGTPVPKAVSELYAPMSRGVVLEAVSTYTYRTPHYQLSGAQDYKPAHWTGQNHIWKATLDPETYVFTTYPGGLEGDYMGGEWTGGWTPRATIHRNVGIFQYRRPDLPILDDVLFVDYTHAFVPRDTFDEILERGSWVIGRKGDAYVALYSQRPTAWSMENGYELIAQGRENVWIVELGDGGRGGTFEAFAAAIEAAAVSVGEVVTYGSPSLGPIEVGWTGPMTIAGEAVDLGPHDRWDNPYCRQRFGDRVTAIAFGGKRLELDFATPRRSCVRTGPP